MSLEQSGTATPLDANGGTSSTKGVAHDEAGNRPSRCFEGGGAVNGEESRCASGG